MGLPCPRYNVKSRPENVPELSAPHVRRPSRNCPSHAARRWVCPDHTEANGVVWQTDFILTPPQVLGQVHVLTSKWVHSALRKTLLRAVLVYGCQRHSTSAVASCSSVPRRIMYTGRCRWVHCHPHRQHATTIRSGIKPQTHTSVQSEVQPLSAPHCGGWSSYIRGAWRQGETG